jgi:hypothetical protein
MYFKFITLVARFFGLIMCLWSAIFIFTMILDWFKPEDRLYNQTAFEFFISIAVFGVLFFLGVKIVKRKTLFGK